MEFKCEYISCKAKCCRNIKTNDFIVNYDLGEKRFIHFLVNPNNSGIGLFNYEKDKLLDLGKKLGIVVSVKPFRGVLTKKGKVLVFKWFLDHNDCPFLKNNDCLIYKYRPIICKSFPLIPPFSCQPMPDQPVISKYCPNSCLSNELMSNYNLFIKKQNKIISEINLLIDKGLILKERTSRVIRLINNEKSVIEEMKI